ncbi:MAG: M23 family metallopeptidase [Acidobacteriota bacterium]
MSGRSVLVLLGAFLFVALGVAIYLAGQEPGPVVRIIGPDAIGQAGVVFDASVDALGSRLSRFDVVIEQGTNRNEVLSLDTPGATSFTQVSPTQVRISRTIPTSSVPGLRDGPAMLRVGAGRRILFGLREVSTTVTHSVKVQLTPPILRVMSTHHYVRMGGAEAVVYRAAPPDTTSGVMVGDRFYPGFAASGVAGGQATDPSLKVAFFALAFDQDLRSPIRLYARDHAGNTTTADFPYRTFPGNFATSTVRLDEPFLARVVPAILESTPGFERDSAAEDLLSAFLAINRRLRERNAEQIARLAKETSSEWLSRGPFARLRRSSSESVFADHRTYFYEGREVDQQVHLGIDLASIRRAPVTSAQAGRVLLAGYLGIYGNCIILDHGMGVQSLYAHLSSMEVEKGDRVERGEVIGRSGMTGLAGGDHVHFTMLVGGTPVNPIEWWDRKWIHDRVERKLEEAGIVEPPVGAGSR